jgi:hypothetical protein
MNVNLHIERLILDGLPDAATQGPHLRSAVERELARMLAENGLSEQWRAGGAVPRTPVQQFNLAPDARPAAIGRSVAQSVYRGIGGGT